MNTFPIRQGGLVLLAMLVMLLVASLSFQVSNSMILKDWQQDRARQTQLQLHAAREALIARAVNDDNRPGSLPCPDLATDSTGLSNYPGDGKGDMLTRDQCPSPVGWFPWVTLNIARPEDPQHGTLWFIAAPGLRDDDSAYPINSNTPTGLSHNGEDEIAAILIAAAPPDSDQQRPSNNPADYLKGQLTGSNPYAYQLDDFREQTLVLNRATLFAAVENRVAHSVRRCLAAHHQQTGTFPWPAPFSDNESKGQSGQYFGRIPLTQPTQGSTHEAQQAHSRLQTQQEMLAFASNRSEQLLAIQALAAQTQQIDDWLNSLGKVSTELEGLANESESRLLALVSSIDSAASNDRISRSEGTTIRSRHNLAITAVDRVIDAILRYGLDPDGEVSSETHTPRMHGKFERERNALIAIGEAFFALDGANPRPVQQTLVAPARAIADAALPLMTYSQQMQEHARNSKLSAQLARTASSSLLDSIERKNGALDNLNASLSKPSSAQEARTEQSLLEVRQASEVALTTLNDTAHTALGAPATAWPMVWASPHCQFLQSTTGWWQKNTWADSVFYHFADPSLGTAGLLQVAGLDQLSLIVIAAGAARPGQQRPSQDINDYLEGRNAQQPVQRYEHFQDRSQGNDQLAF